MIPGHRSTCQMTERAKAGLVQLSAKQYDVKSVRVRTTRYRVQAQVLDTPTSRILWLNTYLPTDPQLQRYDDGELQGVLMEVMNILQTAVFDDIVWGSDLNWDPSRNRQFSRTLSLFVQETGIVSLWERYRVPYTHVHTGPLPSVSSPPVSGGGMWCPMSNLVKTKVGIFAHKEANLVQSHL